MVPGRVTLHRHSDDARGEVYKVDDLKLPRILDRLDHLENNGTFYVRAKIQVMLGKYEVECITYLFMPKLSEEIIVERGEWSQSCGK